MIIIGLTVLSPQPDEVNDLFSSAEIGQCLFKPKKKMKKKQEQT
jgi:hypothetical protein